MHDVAYHFMTIFRRFILFTATAAHVLPSQSLTLAISIQTFCVISVASVCRLLVTSLNDDDVDDDDDDDDDNDKNYCRVS